MPEVLQGNKQPKNAEERVELARIASLKGLYASAAKLCSQVIEAEPKAAEPGASAIRYSQAGCAALAGTGRGAEKPALDERQMAEWRKRALEWLKADLAFWTKQVEHGTADAKKTVRQTLEEWKGDAAFAGVRDEGDLKKLLAEEQREWRGLWTDVEKVLKRTSR